MTFVERVRRHRRSIRLAIAVVCLAAMVWTVRRLGPRNVLHVARDADPWWVLLAVPPLLLRFALWGEKWRRMLVRHGDGKPSFVLTMRIIAAGTFVNLTTPTVKLGGGVLRGVLLHRHLGWKLSSSYGWSMADQVTNVLGNLLLYAVLALFVSATVPLDGSWNVALAVSGALGAASIAAVIALRGWGWRRLQDEKTCLRMLGLVPARFRKQESTDESVRRVRRVFGPVLHGEGGAGTFLVDLCGGAAAFGALCVSNAMVLRAIGVESSLPVVATAVIMGYFAGVLVGAWGGIGVTEAALTALFVRFGVSPGLAAAGALLHRAMYYAVILSFGGLALLYESRMDAGNRAGD